MAFGCLLPAPHGGIFVLPIITNPGMYFLSILIGSLVTMVILGVVKPSIKKSI